MILFDFMCGPASISFSVQREAIDFPSSVVLGFHTLRVMSLLLPIWNLLICLLFILHFNLFRLLFSSSSLYLVWLTCYVFLINIQVFSWFSCLSKHYNAFTFLLIWCFWCWNMTLFCVHVYVHVCGCGAWWWWCWCVSFCYFELTWLLPYFFIFVSLKMNRASR